MVYNKISSIGQKYSGDNLDKIRNSSCHQDKAAQIRQDSNLGRRISVGHRGAVGNLGGRLVFVEGLVVGPVSWPRTRDGSTTLTENRT